MVSVVGHQLDRRPNTHTNTRSQGKKGVRSISQVPGNGRVPRSTLLTHPQPTPVQVVHWNGGDVVPGPDKRVAGPKGPTRTSISCIDTILKTGVIVLSSLCHNLSWTNSLLEEGGVGRVNG